jgi:hypothetical protein
VVNRDPIGKRKIVIATQEVIVTTVARISMDYFQEEVYISRISLEHKAAGINGYP